MAEDASNDNERVCEEDEEGLDEEDVREIMSDGEAPPQSDDENEGEGEGEGDAEELDEDQPTGTGEDPVVVFAGHTDAVFCVAVCSTDSGIAVSGGCDDCAYIWNLADGTTRHQLTGHTDSVAAVAFSADGVYVATGGLDGRVLVWRVATGEQVVALDGPGDIEFLRWHPKGPVVFAGSKDGTAWMWSIPAGTVMQVFAGHSDSVCCGDFTPDGKSVVTGSADRTVSLWNPRTGAAVQRITGGLFHEQGVMCLAINADNVLAVSGGEDGSVRVSHLVKGKVTESLQGHTDSVESVGWCSTMPLLLSGSLDGKVIIWDAGTLGTRAVLQHPMGVVRAVWHPSAPLVATLCLDNTVRLWDARTGECAKTFGGCTRHQLDITFSPDGRKLLVGGDDNVVRVYSTGAE